MPNWGQVISCIAITLVICAESQERRERELWIVKEKEEEKGGGGGGGGGGGSKEAIHGSPRGKVMSEREPLVIGSQLKKSPRKSLGQHVRRTRRWEDEDIHAKDFKTPEEQVIMVSALRAPKTAVPEGGNLRLECDYKEGFKGFYSVRWWKGQDQFYSFVPESAPHQKVDHGLRGVNVVVSQSDNRFVTLRDISMATSGLYRCEVMSEGPQFRTSNGEASVKVVHAPEPPVLEGLLPSYRVGSTLDITCKMRRSIPEAQFVFILNGQPEKPSSTRLQHYNPTIEHSDPNTHKTYFSDVSSNSFSPSYSSSFPSSYSFSSSSSSSFSSSYPPSLNSSDTRAFTSRVGLHLPLSAAYSPRLHIVCMASVDTYVQNVTAEVDVYNPSPPFISLFLNNGRSTSSSGAAVFLVGVAVFLNLFLTCSAASYSSFTSSSYVSASITSSAGPSTPSTAATNTSAAGGSLARECTPAGGSSVTEASAVSWRCKNVVAPVTSSPAEEKRPCPRLTRRHLVNGCTLPTGNCMGETAVSTAA